jgi:shikimate dehydrogenase
MGEIQGYGSERYLFGCIVKVSLDSILRMILKKRKGHSNMKNYRAELTGVFGDPVDDNPTGVVEEAAFAAKNLNYRYLTIKVLPEDLGKAMDSVKIFGMKGINLTMPHKIKVLPYLDELSPAAEIIGAVNTVIQKEGKLFGENTDGKGFVTALKNSGETLDKKNVTILGAGGAARAIAVECALNGVAHINIINRSIEKGEELASLIQMKTDSSAKYLNWKNNMAIPSDTDILINATSIGFSPNVTDKPDIDYTAITPEMCVCDVIFNPAETIFLKSAAENGAKTITGLGMLVQQAALNFTLWTGVEAPVDVMEDALKKEFE